MNGADRELMSIFSEAVELATPEDRAAYLDDACGADQELRCRVEALVQAHQRAGNFLRGKSPAAKLEATGEFTPSPQDDERETAVLVEGPGTVIGPYKLLEQIGEGGMGLVFVAEQQQPVKRRVALKIIKPGMDSRQVIARFEAERQALAMMDHPHIAKVHDGGTTSEGRPYFVMELVKGTPITDYCDAHLLPTRQRLELFLDVCHAVQHAHQKGIIHRDIKPSNVLVSLHDTTPVVKVIDFGIAKATGGMLTDKTIYTAFAQMMGTPLYMSPEQAGLSDLDIDTRSDVYSLGVLLYELLTGTTPFENETLKRAGYDEMRRIIREDEPPRPSARLSTMQQARLSTIAEQRGLEPRHLSKHLRGELDWIVMRALEKDRNRRYESASAFAADLRRYLADEPVQARPPSVGYRLRKFARRNRARLVAASFVLIVSSIGVGVVGVMSLQRAGRLRQVQQAVVEDLKEAEVYQSQEKWSEALPALERANGRLEGSGLDALQAEVAQRRRDVDLVARLEKARLEASEQGDPTAVERACATAFKDNGFDVEELSAEEVARRIRASAIGIHLIRALDNWTYVREHQIGGNYQVLIAIAQLADDDRWRQQLRDPQLRKDWKALERLAEGETAWAQPPESVMNLFHLLDDSGATEAGIRLLRRAQQIYPADFWINFQLGTYLMRKPATAAEAVGFCRAALVVRPESPRAHWRLGEALQAQGKLPEAKAAQGKAIAIVEDKLKQQRIKFGPDHEETLNTMRSLGVLLQLVGRFQEAIPLLEKDLERWKPKLGAEENLVEFVHTAEVLDSLADSYNKVGRPQDAVPLREFLLDVWNWDERRAPTNMERLGELYLELNRSQDAVPLLEKALEQEKIMFGLDHEETLLTMHNLGFALTQEGRIQEALTLLETVVETEKSKLGPDNESTLSSLTALGNVYEMAGKLEEAAHVQSEVLERRKKKDPKSPDFAAIAGSLGLNLLKQRKYAEAEPLLHECLAIRAEKLSDHWLRFNAQSMLGEALLGEKKYAEAEPLLLQGYEGMRHRERKIPAIGRIRLPEAAERLVHLYEATNQPEKAKKWRAELAECCEAIRLKKDYDKPHNDLGIAAAKSREAIRLKKYSAEAHNNLGIALSAKGHLDEAIAEFREAIRLKKDFAMAHNNLRAALRQVELDHELPAILSGKQQPADIGERLALAELCVMPHKKLYAAALKLYEEAFAADPRLVGEQPSTPRYNAACAAALAGCGQGKEADQTGDQARARLRRRSLNWLRAELTAWSKALQEQPDQARSALQQTIQHWQQDPDFNGVRDSQALAKLPPEEQEAWRNLWADVAKLLERARTIKEKDPEPVPPPKEVP